MHIIRCFKKDLGITPHKYIATMKVNLAIAYMREGKSRTEIADRLGFESLFCFLLLLPSRDEDDAVLLSRNQRPLMVICDLLPDTAGTTPVWAAGCHCLQ